MIFQVVDHYVIVKGSIHHYHVICNLEHLNYLENNGAAMGELPFKTTLYPYIAHTQGLVKILIEHHPTIILAYFISNRYFMVMFFTHPQ